MLMNFYPQDIRFFFNSDQRLENTAQFKNTSLCIVKPHAVKEGKSNYIK